LTLLSAKRARTWSAGVLINLLHQNLWRSHWVPFGARISKELLDYVSGLNPEAPLELAGVQWLTSFGLVIALVTLAIDQNPPGNSPRQQVADIEQSLKVYADLLAPTGNDTQDRDQALAIISVAADLAPEAPAPPGRAAVGASSSSAEAPAPAAES
jgi:hypothetical protein